MQSIKKKYQFIINYFQAHQPNPQTELHYKDAYELLVSVILSAQCTDKRVNATTPALFKTFPTIKALSQSTADDIYTFIKSISYPHNKAKHLLGMAKKVIADFQGDIPLEVSALITLPGVGRKTAHVVTSVLAQQPNMAVDTHVFRVSARLGLTKNATTPLMAEKQLVMHIPPSLIHKMHHWLILHGRYTCLAKKPLCNQCPFQDICLYIKQNKIIFTKT